MARTFITLQRVAPVRPKGLLTFEMGFHAARFAERGAFRQRVQERLAALPA